MYVTKVIERFGSIEMATEAIDELCNKMDKDEYALITYRFYANNEKVMLAFKKGIEKSFV